MAEPLSEQSLELFDGAQRAIDRSVELRAQTELAMAEARNRVLQLELATSRNRTASLDVWQIAVRLSGELRWIDSAVTRRPRILSDLTRLWNLTSIYLRHRRTVLWRLSVAERSITLSAPVRSRIGFSRRINLSQKINFPNLLDGPIHSSGLSMLAK
ncbi:hypothetical protein [Bradyrhizobium sp. CCBAU 53421]|uniref:hypothetical protein n=1 Tax=Bradyrhizobium sp. CCBAU 53421 TaxID=1325120 RepID=UPI00188BCEC7|nr:hypothetical protein [Bradyrhizobium sp. CCBAU 53421]